MCTLLPLRTGLTMRFAENTQHDTSKVLRLPRNNNILGLQSAAPATKNATHLLKTSQKYCACHTKRCSTRYETRWNVTKSHACYAKWSYATLETSNSEPFCKTSHTHGHTALTWTVANGCERLRVVANGCATSGEHSSTPHPQSETGTFATHSGIMDLGQVNRFVELLLNSVGGPSSGYQPRWIGESYGCYYYTTLDYTTLHYTRLD